MKNILRSILAAAAIVLLPAVADAQTCPRFSQGAVLTAGQWQACFDAKQNALGYTPVNRAGDTMTGAPLIMFASSTTSAGIRLLQGAAPTSPVNGDLWTTTVGLYVRINGVTIGPLSGGTSSSFAATSPITVSFPSSVVTYACATCVTSSGGGAITGAAPVAVSAAGVVSITGAAGQILAGASPAFTATPTLGASGTLGTLTFGNATSGLLTLRAVTGALGTVTVSLPAATDTLVGKNTTDTLTNKTFDTAGTGNSFSINSLAATANTGTGAVVRAATPTISALTVTGSFTATGLVANASLVNSSTTVNGQTCTLGSTCTITATAASVTIGTTTISSGTTTRILYDNAGVLGEYTISGSGTVVAMAAAPVFTTPTLGVAVGTSLALAGCTISTNAFCATGTANISGATTIGGALTYGGVTLSNAVTGTGNMVLSTSPTLSGTVAGSITVSGNNTYSGTALFTGALASTGSNGQASIGASSTAGGQVGGKGSSKDLTLANSAGTSVCDVATGTTTINCATLTLTNQLAGSQVVVAANASGSPSATFGVVKCDGTTITCTSGTITAVGAAATSVAIGTTTIASGTTTRILYDNAGVLGEYTISGSGTVVAMATSPSFTTPTLGVASATSINKVAITAPATSSTLTIADGKTLTVSNTLTFTGTDSSSVAFGAGGTVPYQPNASTSWTATDASGAALTFSGPSSAYTRIGNMVFAQGSFSYPSTADVTTAKVGSLPVNFPGTGYGAQCSITYSNSASLPARILPIAGTATFNFYTAAGNALTNANMSGSAIYFQCIYPAT